MASTSASAPIPLYKEGTEFWQDLTGECKRYVDCANETLARNGVNPEGLLRCTAAPESLQIIKTAPPSLKVELILNLFSWGPVIGVTIARQQNDGKRCLPQEFELPLASDFDSRTVAIHHEGRGFSPHEVASFLTQYFHPCYPGIAFPC